MVGIHGRQVATTAQGNTASDWDSGTLHAASQLQAMAVITWYGATALYLITTADNPIAAKVGALLMKKKLFTIWTYHKLLWLFYFSMIFQIVSFG